MTTTISIQYLFEHRDDIAALVTYLMTSLVIGARAGVALSSALVGFAGGLRRLALRTAFTWDDRVAGVILRAADGLHAFAVRLDRFARALGDLHGRLMPRSTSVPNPTPSLERVGAAGETR